MEEKNEHLLERINALLLEGHAAVSKADHQKLILILGATGCGKSTAINYLTGCQMREVIDELTGQTSIECENPVAEISSSVFSKTLYPNVVELKKPVEGFDAMLCDTAGFGDNRGVAHDICAAVLLGELFRNSETIRGIIVLIPEEDILENRLTKVLDLFQQLNLCLNKEHFRNSITFFISKNFQKKTEKQIYYIMKTKYAQFCAGTDEQIQGKKWLFEELLKDEGKNIHLCQPLDTEARDRILKSVMQLEEVREKNTAFEYPISADTKLTVNALVNSMVSAILNDIDYYLKEYNKALSQNILLSNRIEDMKKAQDLVQRLKVLSEKKGPNVDIEDFLEVIIQQGADLSTPSCIELVNTIFHKLHILKTLQSYCEEPMKITVLSTQIEVLIQSGMEKIMEQGMQLAVFGLESIMDTLEVQNYVAAKGLKQVYNQLSHSDESQYKEQQLKELSKCLAPREKEEYETNLNFLFSYGKRGNDMVNSLADRFLVNPFDIQPVVKNGRNIYYITSRTHNLVMSSVVKSLINMKLSDTDTLYFMAKNTIYMDENLGMKIASGKNVVLACQDLWVGSNVKINVSGEDGREVQGNPYGQNGENGKDAGNIFLFVRGKIMNYNLTLVANGGNGSRGTNGQPGAAGEKGEDGIDASYEEFSWYDTDKGVIKHGTPGKPGNPGGKGKNAGVGGNGGKKGKIVLITAPSDNQAELLKECKITAIDGEKGANGEPGSGGPGGKGGYHGFNTLSYIYSHIFGDLGCIYYKGYFTDWERGRLFDLTKIYKPKGENISYAYRDETLSRRYAACGEEGKKGDYNAPNPVTNTAPGSLDEKDIKEEYNVRYSIQKGAK